jgi:hypothetical protein
MSPAAAISVLIAIGSIGVTSFWLYSDKHNTEVFLPRSEYKKDQEQYQKDQQSLAIILERIEKRQDESSKDIKDILKEQRSK